MAAARCTVKTRSVELSAQCTVQGTPAVPAMTATCLARPTPPT